MPLSVRHIFSNAIADGTNTQIVRPSDWNSAHALTLNLSGTDISAAFANANGISFGTNAGGSVTASHNALTSQSNQALSGSNGSFTFQTATFGNSNGVSFLTTNGSLVGSVATSYAASNHSHGNPTLSLAGGLSGATASNSAGFTLSLTQASAAPSPINFSAGTTTSAVSGLTFSDANRVSFGLGTGASAGVVTGSIDAAGTTTGFTGGASISGSMTHNTAGLAVSLSHPAWLTTAMQSNAATISNIRVSGGTTSNLLSAMTFADGNGVSFGLNAGTLTASHNGLTTAMASNRGSDFMGTNTALTANGVSVTANSSGLSLNFPAFLTTAMASNRGSDFVHASAAFAGTNASGTIASNGVSVSVAAQSVQPVAVSASNGSYNFSTLKFVEGSGVTWATQANGIQASVKTDYLTTAMLSNAATISNINFSAGTTSGLLSALTFADGGGVSFGLNAGTVTGTVATTYAASNHSHGNPTLALTNLSGTTASNSAGLTLSLSAAAPGAGGGIALSAGSDSNFTNGTVTFGNAFSGSFVTSNGSVVYSNAFLTTAAQSGHSHGNPTLALTNLSGTTASNSAGLTLSLSANGAAAGVGIEAGTRTATTAGNLRWETGNGITFGLDAVGGSVMTASHNGLTTAAQSDHSHGNPTLALTNISGTTASNSNGLTLSLSAGAGGAGDGYNIVSLGTTGTTGTAWSTASGTVAINGSGGVVVSQNNSNQIVISGPATSSIANTGQLSMSVNGSTISLGVPEGRNTQRHQWPPGQLTAVAALGNGSFSIHRMEACNPISASRLDVPLLVNIGSTAAANTWGLAVTAFAAVYTKNSNTLSSLSSGSVTWSTSKASNNAGGTQINGVGIRPMSVPININMTPGEYYVGFGISTNTSSAGTATTTLGNTWSIMGGMIYSSAVPHVGDFTAVTNTSTGLYGGHGVYSAAISTVPPTVSLSAINQTGSYYARGAVGLIFRNQ